MCGIAGFYGFRNDNLIEKFSKELTHRGPDGEGFYTDDNASLLNRRLAIIDRKGGDQPIYNEDKSVVVTYNGEIYNFRELRWALEKRGHNFATKSDTEVIVHGYEEWGEICFERFNGMFAVALYDLKKKKLILARDHFGIKPLYFSFINNSSEILSRLNSNPDVHRDQSFLAQPQNLRNRVGTPFLKQKVSKNFDSLSSLSLQLMFSSEIKPLIYSGLIKKKPNDRIIYRYLKYRVHDDQRETFFAEVYRLMPGEYMTIQNSEFRIQNYTSLKEDLLNVKETERLGEYEIKKFKEKLIEAVRLRLISEVPVGTCLSGGLDSSTIVSVVNKLLQDNVMEAKSVGSIQKTFSAVFPGGANDEEKYIDEVTKNLKLKIKNFKTYPKPEEFFKDIEEFIRVQEEPTISTGPYAQFKVMQLAHKKVTVLLDGQGADEMMAGYDPYLFVYLRQLWKEKKYVIFLKELFSSMDIIGKYVIRNLTGANSNVSIHWMKESFLKKFKNEEFSNVKDNLKKRLIEDIFGNSLQALLRYEDRNSMSFSIEGRVPFLDSNLLRYLFSLPDEAIVKNGWNKFILRQTMKDLLPELIVKRRNKIGFTTPEYEWFLRMKNKIYSIFLSESFAKRKYFNQQEVLKAFQLFIEGKTDDTMLFWRFLNTELWLRIFFDPQPVNRFTNSRIHEFGKPNEGKKLEIKIDEKRYLRFPIRTELFKKGDEVTKKIAELLYSRIAKNNITIKQYNSKKWFIVVSEKIVALAQGRSYFIWDIKAGFWSKLLARFVKKTPYGIGLGSQWTMELAIREVGVVRVISAAIIAAITKPFGWSGLFYRIAGEEVASIDGPTEYSLYPSNVSAKLGPKDPQRVAENIKLQITNTKSISNFKFQILNFMGVVIIDANDLGQKVLGNSTGLDNKLIEKIFSDNPMGQADEQTPLALVSELK